MKKRRLYILISIVTIFIVILIVIFNSGEKTTEMITADVEFGDFQINVTTTGELEAKNSEKILGPTGLRNFRIWEIKIEDIIPDGTVVDSGDYVASLDKTELANKLKDKEIDVEQFETQFIKIQLDTTLELRQARDELINLKYNLEERQIAVDQSIYEPPATRRQVQIDMDKANRAYHQAQSNYIIRKDKKIAEMQEISASLRKARQEYDKMKEIENSFRIYAPKSGMVIYRRRWDGQKQGIGSSVGVWDPVVAELPDLTTMQSKTYVNEIDISKVSVGQDVEVGVDAFPDKTYTGFVTEVANIGEQLRNTNAKVFEVIIEVHEYDSILRPAMTTKNMIITDIIDSVLFIPIECVHANDSMTYVFVNGRKRQVIIGKSNENDIVVREGLSVREEVSLSIPNEPDDLRLVLLDPEIVEKYERETDSIKNAGIQTRPDMEKEDFMKKMKGGGMKKMSGDRGGKKNGGKKQ